MSTPPPFEKFDHIHVHVADRQASEQWYKHALGLVRAPEYAFWATADGPLTLTNDTGTIHIALFERPPQSCHSTIALNVTGTDFAAWRRHLAKLFQREIAALDHDVSWSLYFSDPDGNPYEITTYDYESVRAALTGPVNRDHKT